MTPSSPPNRVNGVWNSISRSIIEAHEGKLWDICNRTGGGTFKFTLATAA
jgi:signal transduction histidine kinase